MSEFTFYSPKLKTKAIAEISLKNLWHGASKSSPLSNTPLVRIHIKSMDCLALIVFAATGNELHQEDWCRNKYDFNNKHGNIVQLYLLISVESYNTAYINLTPGALAKPEEAN